MTDEKGRILCGKCKKELVRKKVNFQYMRFTFSHEVPVCPICGEVYLSEKLVNEKIKALKVFLIVDNPQDALRIYKGIDETPDLNIGGVQSQDGRTELTQAVYFNESELEALDEIAERKINVSVKLVPSDSPQDYLNLRKK